MQTTHTEIAPSDVLRRLAALETSARTWRTVAIGCGGGVAALSFVVLGGLSPIGADDAVAQSPPTEKLVAQAFEMVDAGGKLRARLGTSKDGSPALELFDAQGIAQATLALGNFDRTEDARIREATRGRASNGQPIGRTDAPLTAVLRLGRSDEDHAIELGAGEQLRVLRLRDDFGDERMEMRVGPYIRPDMRADERARVASELVEATFRLKAPDEFLALELGVEPVSIARPDDRRGNATGTLIDQATPYITMYGWCEQPVFMLSNWAFDHPSLDLWAYGDKKTGERIFAVPGSDTEEREAAKRTEE